MALSPPKPLSLQMVIQKCEGTPNGTFPPKRLGPHEWGGGGGGEVGARRKDASALFPWAEPDTHLLPFPNRSPRAFVTDIAYAGAWLLFGGRVQASGYATLLYSLPPTGKTIGDSRVRLRKAEMRI